MNDIVKLCKLSVPEKLNLKAVIKKLSNKQVMCSYVMMKFLIFVAYNQSYIDPEEVKAIDIIKTKLKLIDDSIALIATTTQS